MSHSVLYLEEESFTLLRVMILVVYAVTFVFALLFVPDEPSVRALLVGGTTLALLFSLNAYQFRVTVYLDRIHLRVGRVLPMWWTSIRPADVASVNVVDLGWWRRWGAGVHVGRYRDGFAVMVMTGGPRAVYIQRKRGPPVVIGSEQPELLARAIEESRREAVR